MLRRQRENEVVDVSVFEGQLGSETVTGSSSKSNRYGTTTTVPVEMQQYDVAIIHPQPRVSSRSTHTPVNVTMLPRVVQSTGVGTLTREMATTGTTTHAILSPVVVPLAQGGATMTTIAGRPRQYTRSAQPSTHCHAMPMEAVSTQTSPVVQSEIAGEGSSEIPAVVNIEVPE
eukprot:Lankesteria_metandrocarpae@DN9816_c0_g1_i1.p2